MKELFTNSAGETCICTETCFLLDRADGYQLLHYDDIDHVSIVNRPMPNGTLWQRLGILLYQNPDLPGTPKYIEFTLTPDDIERIQPILQHFYRYKVSHPDK